jgi:hypothetical protein
MPTVTTHAPGTFCWLDLGAHDLGVAREFYTRLFGWETVENRYGPDEGDVYVMFTLRGRDVGAAYAMDPNQAMMGIASAWLCYVAVESADAGAARARELGASLMADPFDVMEVGRMALVQDPGGALFALWQGSSHPGVGVRDEPGAAGWWELATHDTERADEFYSRLFGWTGQAMEGTPGIEYTVFSGATGMVGGMYGITAQMEGMPPCWMPYFIVDGTDAAAEKVASLGGTVLHGPLDVPGVGRMALIRDPQGAMFNIITYAPRAPESGSQG